MHATVGSAAGLNIFQCYQTAIFKKTTVFDDSMTEKKPRGITSKDRLTNDAGAVIFPCPACGTEIRRSKKSRMVAAKYECPDCGFEGPN